MLIQLVLAFLCLFKVKELGAEDANLGQKKVNFDIEKEKLQFDESIKKNGLFYKRVTEHERQLQIITKNLEDANNKNNSAGKEIYKISKFSNLTSEKLARDDTRAQGRSDFIGNNEDDLYMNFTEICDERPKVPETWDWRKLGVVTPVKHQKTCNTCWAFSAVGVLESQYAIQHGKLLTLSEQQLVDCFLCSCFNYSFAYKGLNAAAKLGGFMLLKDYPYEGAKGRCRFNKRKVAVKHRGGRIVRGITDEEQLKRLVYQYGPVSVFTQVTDGFINYTGGIATAQNLKCENKNDHIVLVVGYGTERGGDDYWIIKNSYGSEWGEKGYMRLLRGENACNILDEVDIAVLN